MKIFLDANVLVSILNKEYPVYPYSSRVLSLMDQSSFKMYTTPICLAIAFYFSEKKSGAKIAKQKLALLVSKINVAMVSNAEVSKTITNKKVVDVEDGFEFYAALHNQCDAIITEDKNDFYFSSIPVFTCQTFLKNYILN